MEGIIAGHPSSNYIWHKIIIFLLRTHPVKWNENEKAVKRAIVMVQSEKLESEKDGILRETSNFWVLKFNFGCTWHS